MVALQNLAFAFTKSHLVTLGEKYEHGGVFFCLMPYNECTGRPR